MVGPGTGVLSIQNGVDNEDKLARILGPGHVLGGVAQVFATIEAPGVIAHMLLGRILLGEMDGTETARARAFLAACGRAEIPAEISDRIVRTLWEKYVYLVAQSGMTGLTRCTAGVLRALPETRAMYRRIIDEMVALGAAEGAGLADDYADQCMTILDAVGANASSSLHHDLTHGKRIELEALQGHAVRLGERHGVNTPTLRDVYAALRPHRDGAPALGRRARIAYTGRMSPARRLWAYLLRYRGRYAVGILFLIAATGVSLCIPWTIKNAIDAIRHEGGAPLPRYVGIILLLAAANGVARMGSRFAMLGAGQWVERDIRDDLFAHLLTMPPAFYHAHRVGDLMSRASSDVSAVRQLAGFGTVMMSGTTLAFVGTLTAMWLIDPWLTVYALTPFPLLVLIAKRFIHQVAMRSTEVQEQLGVLSAKIQENLGGIAVVRAYTVEAREIADFGRLNDEYLRRSLRLARVQALSVPLMGLVSGIGGLIVLWLGGKAVVDQRITLGAFVAFNALSRAPRVADDRARLDAVEREARPRLDAAHRRDPRDAGARRRGRSGGGRGASCPPGRSSSAI